MAVTTAREPGSSVARPAAGAGRLARSSAVVLGVLLAVAALLIAIWLVREVVTWLIASAFLAFSIEPLVETFQRHRLGRGAATALAFATIAAGVLVFAFVVVPPAVDGARSLAEQIPAYVEQLQNTGAADTLGADGAIASAGAAAQDTANFFGGADRVIDIVGALASGGFAAFMIFTFTLYFLVYGRELVGRVAARLAPGSAALFRSALADIYVMNTGYWYGKFLIALIAGLTTFASMKLLGLPYAAPLSVFVGITDLIPNVGATLGTIPVVLVGLLEEPWKGAAIGGILILYQQVENNLVTPKVFKKTVELHPFLSVVCVMVFSSLFGIVGALIAVPVTRGIQIAAAAYRAARRGVAPPGGECRGA